MSTIREIQDRVILVDYYPASHGHFLIDTLHSILYADLNEDSVFSKNYHSSKLATSIFLQGAYSENTFLDFEVDEKTLQKFLNKKYVFWPAHWSLYWSQQKQLKNNHTSSFPDLTQHINDIPIIEIYVPKDIWLRHFINFWFNIGTYSHEQLSNNEFFIDNFYNHCKQIHLLEIFETDIAKTITLTPDQHTFTQLEVLSILENLIFSMHGRSYRTLPILNMPNKTFSISMDNFYDFNLFKKTILDINNFFELSCDINNNNLESTWNKFMSMQYPINVYNSAIADDNLTIIEQAYRNFLNKHSTKL
jgi:hypothetical protein